MKDTAINSSYNSSKELCIVHCKSTDFARISSNGLYISP
jgi:hypothetical protein